MKTLIVRIAVPNAVTDSSLNELGEELQQTLKVDCQQNGMDVHSVEYEIRSKEQVITVTLAAGQKPYKLVERKGRRLKAICVRTGSDRSYQALRHFFEDIGLTVKSISSIIILALCAVGSFGQSYLIEAPKPKPIVERPKPVLGRTTDKKFWLTVGILAASDAADSITTRRALDRGSYETNPLYGTHPSNARMIAVGGAYFAAEVVLAYELKRFSRKHKWARWMWAVEPSFQTERHINWALHNERLANPPRVQ